MNQDKEIENEDVKEITKRYKIYGWISLIFPLIGGGLFVFLIHLNISPSIKYPLASLIFISLLFLGFALSYMFTAFKTIYEIIYADKDYVDAIDEFVDELEAEQDKQAKKIYKLEKQIKELKKIINNT